MAVGRSWRRRPFLGLVALLALLVAAYLTGFGNSGGDRPGAGPLADTGSTATSTADSQPSSPGTGTPAPDLGSGLPLVSVADLPAEARDVLALIEAGGPFRYDRDGVVFGNREGLLPPKPDGYYREYTVDTPGESDRGARRLVTGADGELYYSADHYDSFVAVGGTGP